jgi:hypothetical protein
LGFEPRHPVTQKANHALLGALVQTFAPERDPLVMSFDETLWNDVEGGGSPQRDLPRPLLSGGGRFVKTSGLRWICVVLLAEV